MGLQTDTDWPHLARAIELAEQGRGLVSPNPLVGAVVARDARILGEGFHASLGGPHAEREALAACAGADLSGATLYVSLEPCCHEGKTPPCTDAILEAGVQRVVVASDDPTEKAAGRGLGSCATRAWRSRSQTATSFAAQGCSTSLSASTRGRAAPTSPSRRR